MRSKSHQQLGPEFYLLRISVSANLNDLVVEHLIPDGSKCQLLSKSGVAVLQFRLVEQFRHVQVCIGVIFFDGQQKLKRNRSSRLLVGVSHESLAPGEIPLYQSEAGMARLEAG